MKGTVFRHGKGALRHKYTAVEQFMNALLVVQAAPTELNSSVVATFNVQTAAEHGDGGIITSSWSLEMLAPAFPDSSPTALTTASITLPLAPSLSHGIRIIRRLMEIASGSRPPSKCVTGATHSQTSCGLFVPQYHLSKGTVIGYSSRPTEMYIAGPGWLSILASERVVGLCGYMLLDVG